MELRAVCPAYLPCASHTMSRSMLDNEVLSILLLGALPGAGRRRGWLALASACYRLKGICWRRLAVAGREPPRTDPVPKESVVCQESVPAA